MTVKTNVPTSCTPPFPNILSARRAALTLEAAAFLASEKIGDFLDAIAEILASAFEESSTMSQELQEPSSHSFIVGEVVCLSKRHPPRKAAPGPYKIVAQLPDRDGQFQYRIKSGCEPFYRTVPESELE
jgi:hypothetical protein